MQTLKTNCNRKPPVANRLFPGPRHVPAVGDVYVTHRGGISKPDAREFCVEVTRVDPPKRDGSRFDCALITVRYDDGETETLTEPLFFERFYWKSAGNL